MLSFFFFFLFYQTGTYFRFSLLNSFSKNLMKCCLPRGSAKTSCNVKAHLFTRRTDISFLLYKIIQNRKKKIISLKMKKIKLRWYFLLPQVSVVCEPRILVLWLSEKRIVLGVLFVIHYIPAKFFYFID